MASLLQIFSKICSIEATLTGRLTINSARSCVSHARAALMASDST